MMTDGMLALAVWFCILMLLAGVWMQEMAERTERAEREVAKAEAEAWEAEEKAWEVEEEEADLAEGRKASRVHPVRDICDFAEAWDGRYRTAAERLEMQVSGPWDACSFMEVWEGRYLTAAERVAVRWAAENWKARRDTELEAAQEAAEAAQREREIRRVVEAVLEEREARRDAEREAVQKEGRE